MIKETNVPTTMAMVMYNDAVTSPAMNSYLDTVNFQLKAYGSSAKTTYKITNTTILQSTTVTNSDPKFTATLGNIYSKRESIVLWTILPNNAATLSQFSISPIHTDIIGKQRNSGNLSPKNKN